jgi:thymidylate synthase
MKQYLQLLNKVLTKGERRADRTGTGTLSLFGETFSHNLAYGFPLVTTKKIHVKSVLHELIWIVGGHSNIKYLKDNGVTIWNEWADEEGELGPVYGVQARRWLHVGFDNKRSTVDQLQNAIDLLIKEPTSRRILVSMWNPGELDEMALPPCHYAYQFYVRDGQHLDILVNMRSVDVFLGMPFDIAHYAFLTHMVAMVTGYKPGILKMNFGDTHLYLNHVEQAQLQLTRQPMRLCDVELCYRPSIDDFRYEDFIINNYRSHPGIKADISI